jgi:hypothetical protein
VLAWELELVLSLASSQALVLFVVRQLALVAVLVLVWCEAVRL